MCVFQLVLIMLLINKCSNNIAFKTLLCSSLVLRIVSDFKWKEMVWNFAGFNSVLKGRKMQALRFSSLFFSYCGFQFFCVCSAFLFPLYLLQWNDGNLYTPVHCMLKVFLVGFFFFWLVCLFLPHFLWFYNKHKVSSLCSFLLFSLNFWQWSIFPR